MSRQLLTGASSPPATESIKEQLNTLAGDCNQVKNTFSNILQVPFLQNLSILNPFKVGNSEEKDSINMREVVQRYKDVSTSSHKVSISS